MIKIHPSMMGWREEGIKTLRQVHLLSNETNPFTRQKLTVDMLQDAPEVKQQIAEYREKCRAEAAAAKAAAKTRWCDWFG
jgi:hypothetical protein